MKIEPGYYKISSRYAVFESKMHYLRVFIKNKTKYLQIDNGVPTEADKCEQDVIQGYEIRKRLTKGSPIQVNQPEIIITWKDEEGDSFTLNARSIHVFHGIMKLFPRLAKAIDYTEEPKKS